MIATRAPRSRRAPTGRRLNPAAAEYIPIGAEPLPPPPPPPMKFTPLPWRHLPPPPSFLHPKLLPPAPPTFLRRPIHIVWAPVTYAYPSPTDFGKAAPPPKILNVGLNPPPVKRDAEEDPRKLFRRLVVPPRSHAPSNRPPRASKKKQPLSRRRNRTPADSPPVPEVVNRRSVHYPFGHSTTLMIRNIPNRLSRWELMNLLAEHCAAMNEEAGEVYSEFDLLYLPVDFARLGNLGYAFVNFTSVAGAAGLYSSWNQLAWDKFGYNSPKIRVITLAKLQGERLKEHLQRSLFDCKTDEYLPVELSPACNGFNVASVSASTLGQRKMSGKGLRERA